MRLAGAMRISAPIATRLNAGADLGAAPFGALVRSQPLRSRPPVRRGIFSVTYLDTPPRLAQPPSHILYMPSLIVRRIHLARLAAAAVALFVLSACMMFMKAPTNLDYGRVRASGAGLYRATIKPEGDSIPRGKLQKWTLHLETANGTPVNAVQVTIDGGMPQHGHGLPTKPVVTKDLGNGDHLVEGLKFNMGGWWVLKFRVRSQAGADSVVFNLKL